MEKYKLIFDKKISVWSREYITVEAENLDEAIQKCLDGCYNTDDSEIFYDTEKILDPDEVNGATIEIFEDNGNYAPIYTNYPRLK